MGLRVYKVSRGGFYGENDKAAFGEGIPSRKLLVRDDNRLPDCHHRHSNPGLAAWAAPSRTLTIRERLAELRQLGHDLLDELDVDDRTCAHRQVVPELGFRRVRPLAEDVSSDAT